MSDLSFVAGEFPKLAATSRETADAVRSARPEGGASAFASAMPGADLASPMQAAEEKLADQCMKTSARLEECADSLEAAERDFIAAEEENGQLIGSIVNGDDCGHSGPGGGRGDRKNPRLVPLPSPIGGGNPPQRGPRLPGDPGKQRGGHHPGEGTRGHRRPNPGTGRPKVEPTPFNPVGPLMPLDPIITGPTGPRPLPIPGIELPKVPPVKLPKMGNPNPGVDPIPGFNRFSAELGGQS